MAEEKTLRSSYRGPRHPRFIALYWAGRIGLAEINTGFDRMRRGAAIRQVVAFA
ncbi:hypothetical protein [Amycolatopsis sp. TNS106]|uniref:hypothetical protein n=1 Tax=Amycolatopsis sp. TNS106 TaxID=2861750 RepID=UPI001C573D4B|nr:hypothetical protein [Amycolatopsis sp. TNS106]